jgi:hypothetical protein
MRGTRVGMSLLVATLLSGSACQTANTTIKPPLHEEYTLPPSDDSRFSSPPTYPKEALDNNELKKQPNKPGEQFQGPNGRLGSGPAAMGGY